MFLQIGGRYFNINSIKSIRPYSKPNDPAHWAEIELMDGSRFDDLVLPDQLDAFSRNYFPAPPGYESLGVEVDGDEVRIWSETVIAFAYDAGASELAPITLESGLRESFAVKTPGGTVHCPGMTYLSQDHFVTKKLEAQKRGSK